MSYASTDERTRIAALDGYKILDSAPEQAFDDLTEIAAAVCGVPISLVSFVSGSRQWFKSARGLDLKETSRELSFCAHTLDKKEVLVIPDTLEDSRFSDNALVTGSVGIRFYAGAPIIEGNGHALGTVCVIDTQPRQLSEQQIRALQALARQASNLLDRRALVTERNEFAEETVRALQSDARTKEQLQVALDSAEIATWYFDPVNGVVGGDQRMARFFGLRSSEAPAEVWTAAIIDEDRARVATEFADSLSGAPYFTTYRVLVEGAIRWLRARAKVLTQEDGTVRMVGVCEDITREETLAANLADKESQLLVERGMAANQLFLERERLQMSLTTSNATYFDWIPATDEVKWAGLPPFGVDPLKIPTGASSFQYVHSDDRSGLSNALTQAMNHGRSYAFEYRALWSDGSIRWIRTTGRALTDPDGSIRFLGINTDITERKLAEETLLQTEKLAAVGRMASVISHEINNPLEAITNLLFLLRSSESLTQQDKDYLELADRELARVGQITAQTLRFHRSVNRATEIRADVIVHELLSLYRTRLETSEIGVEIDLTDVSFQAYEGDIRQVLNNLMSNAFDAMRTGGALRVRTRRVTDSRTGRDGAVITVADNGKGIARADHHRIFEAFYSTKGINGTGLGLWIAKRIVHKHKGHLKFRSSTGLRHGSVFRLWLPLSAAPTAVEGWA